MKTLLSLAVVLVLSMLVSAQSGRRGTQIVAPASPPPAEVTAPSSTKPQIQHAAVTAEPIQHYRCSEDGSLARIIEASEVEPKAFSAKDVDARVRIMSRPPPTYTKEARRKGVQGFVVLRALFSANARIDRIRIIKRLPAGLTENALRAACKLRFKPAIKNGKPVAQLVIVEYVFRLAHSSIFAP
ncbi:MAG TPA: energy transducer TonB [Pyrinomonadaceae bacterium]|nr:energy transducer TonB [Pyrinomonadaceae bacterium]